MTMDFLKTLGLGATNPGAYNGEWFGDGPAIESINPATGKSLGSVSEANREDYERVMNVAPDRQRRHHHRLQLPGRGLGLELDARPGLR